MPAIFRPTKTATTAGTPQIDYKLLKGEYREGSEAAGRRGNREGTAEPRVKTQVKGRVGKRSAIMAESRRLRRGVGGGVDGGGWEAEEEEEEEVRRENGCKDARKQRGEDRAH